MGWFAYSRFDQWLGQFALITFAESTQWLAWLLPLLRTIFIVAMLFVAAFTFNMVANVISAPFNGPLAERVEARLTGNQPPVGLPLTQLIISMPGTILHEIGKWIYLARWLILIAILSFIPLIQLAAPLLAVFFGAWVLALEYLDYPMGNHQIKFRDVRGHAKKHRVPVMSFGAVVMLLSAIPVVNLVVVPIAVVAATVLHVDKMHPLTNDV